MESITTKREAASVGDFIKLFNWVLQRSEPIMDNSNKNGQVAFKYILQSVGNLLESNAAAIQTGCKLLSQDGT
jgi:hypothetical protein